MVSPVARPRRSPVALFDAQRIGKAYAWPAAVFGILIIVFGLVSGVVRGLENPLYFVALLISAALIVDFRVQVGRLSRLPALGITIALLSTANTRDELFVSVAVWSVGMFFGILLNTRHALIAFYVTGLSSLAALVWCVIIRYSLAAAWWPVVSYLSASAVYVLIILLVEFARQRGQWSSTRTIGLSSLSLVRVTGLVALITSLSLLIHYIYTLVFPVYLVEGATGQAPLLLFVVAAIFFSISQWSQFKNMNRRLDGIVNAALALPWPQSQNPVDTLTAKVHAMITADAVFVREFPPENNEIGYPVRLSDQKEAYLVAVRDLGGVAFTADDERALEALAHIATETTRVQEDMAGLALRASTDALTGLPNHTALRRALTAANDNRLDGSAIAVLFIDLDGFKELNDRRGHHVGDAMLSVVAQRLRQAARAHDIVARVGGDEFIVVLTELHSQEQATTIAERIIDAVSAPTVVENTELRQLISVGLAYSQSREPDPNALVIDADRSMLDVKKRRRAGGFSAAATLNISSRRSSRINDIVADAIDRDLLSLVFQPIVDITHNRIWAFEALVRYTDPESGAISPGVLIERAKGSGRMDALTKQVMTKAMSAAFEFQRISPSISTIAVNVELGQITEDHLGAFAQELAARYPALTLCLELNEHSLSYVTDELREQATALRDRGIMIALDDYGSEDSSVAALVRIPMDILKLDQSLVGDLKDERQKAVVKALNGLGDFSAHKTIVEGVENSSMAQTLFELGIRHTQGFYYGLPMTADQTLDRLRQFGDSAIL